MAEIEHVRPAVQTGVAEVGSTYAPAADPARRKPEVSAGHSGTGVTACGGLPAAGRLGFGLP